MPLDRATVLHSARLRLIAHGISSVAYPECSWSTWEGDDRSGAYAYDNMSGDVLAFAWDPKRLIGIVFDHESSRSPYAREEQTPEAYEPHRFLPALPESFEPLLQKALRAMFNVRGIVADDMNVTTGFWIDADGRHLPNDEEHGFWMFGRYGMSPEEAMFGRTGQNWMELGSLTEAQARLAVDLASRTPAKLKPEEELTMLEGDSTEGVDLAKAILKTAGIDW